MRKQPERTAKTKHALQEAFWELYCEKPIEKITVKETTDAAGVYRSTFYEYFTDVYAVRDMIENDILGSYVTFIGEVPKIKTVEDGVKLLISFYSLNSRYLVVLLGPHGDPSFLKEIKSRVRVIMQEMFDIPTDDIETEILLEMGYAAVLSMLNYWYEHRDKMTIEEVIDISSQFLQHGLLSYLEKWGVLP